MNIVPATVTPLTAAEALAALLGAMPYLDRNTATLLLSLIWVETGRGSLVQHNAGMITADPKHYAGSVWRPPWFADDGHLSPHLKSLHDLMLAGKAPSAFRAYASTEEGFHDFARVLKKSFPNVLTAAGTGDAPTFVAELRRKYSADYGPKHIATFQRLQREFGPLTAHLPGASLPAAPSPANPGGLGPLLLLALARFI